eukprot:360336_1
MKNYTSIRLRSGKTTVKSMASKICAMIIILITIKGTSTFKGNSTCGDVIIGTVNTNESHYYRFFVDDIYLVHFHTCNSKTDVTVTIYDDYGNDISSPHCHNDNNCNECNNMNDIKSNYSQNFIIPSMEPSKEYYIWINSFGIGLYQIDISCTYASITFSGDISCGDTIINWFNASAISKHYYHLIVDDTYRVNLDSCNTEWIDSYLMTDIYY